MLVSMLLGALSAGDSIEDLLSDYPNVSREDIEAALEFASRLSDYREADGAFSLSSPPESGQGRG